MSAISEIDSYSGIRTKSHRIRLIAGTTIGNALEFFDFTVFNFLMSIMGPIFFPQSTPYGQLLLTTGTFGVGFLMRPLGALAIGAYADRSGRKSAMILTLFLMGLGCAIIALAPTYAELGIGAPALIVFARLLQGLASGGEVGASTALLVEHASPEERGFYSSWQFGSQALGIMIGATLVTILTATLSRADMASWGWRVPFVVGVLTVPAGIYVRRHLQESLSLPEDTEYVGQATKIRKSESMTQLFGRHGRKLGLGIVLMLGTVASAQVVAFYLPAFAARELGIPPVATLVASVVVGFIGFALSPVIGKLIDRHGRKKFIASAAVANLIVIFPCFKLLIVSPSVITLVLIIVALSVLLTILTVSTITMLPEMFPREFRSTGTSVVYGVAVSVFGGFAQFFISWLLRVTQNAMAPAWYMAATIVASLIALHWISDRTAQVLD